MRNILLRSAVLAAVALMLGQVVDADELRKTTNNTAVASNAGNGVAYAMNDDGGLFYNYYTQPGAGTEIAGLYQAPHPTPYKTGHVFYTYEPLRPHEFMYRHNRTYYTYYGESDQFYSDPYCYGRQGYGLNKTTVTWKSGCNHFGAVPVNIFPLQNIRNVVSKAADRICNKGCRTPGCNTCK